MRVRQDAWSHENDLFLAETVLRHIREGSTQVAAFDEVGDQLNRTSAACGYRWNAEVRSQYVQAIETAKKQRKEKKRSNNPEKTQANHKIQLMKKQRSESDKVKPEENRSITLEDCIAFLHHFHFESNPEINEENHRLNIENQKLIKTNGELSLKYDQLVKSKQKIDQEYKILISVISKAQKISEDSFEHKPLLN